ncbi:hypothetical protein [Pseudosulfitobacter pseudonitzschiae]|nr:hypothetical protein [Pseudosulfitobacter pseudonitzschiae]MBM1817718.1 hypothetical protein [Pseudosulfitobacter pseudonitzschiae]MBM1834713.1 hypothetical protein [Pseudosulfitobacter pseudonitzschiae]MBM1839577.1 hypothetical protein [Pseudosulfitobacter pseudonitzschiae]MBM1844428.1 hypothetical protein [Pseudosulfitobacter pseudonitzschiae]MBM1849262.1 hypothetical protein [Pseudosulfitobacter pseudonitzschiae]
MHRWDEAGKQLADFALRLEDAGAEAIALAVKERNNGAVALACTKLPMPELELLLPDLPVADSTGSHIEACVEFIVGS